MAINRSVQDLVQIAANGGGLELDAAVLAAPNLVQIAANAASKRALIIIRNSARLTTPELVQIAANGQGCVLFKD